MPRHSDSDHQDDVPATTSMQLFKLGESSFTKGNVKDMLTIVVIFFSSNYKGV